MSDKAKWSVAHNIKNSSCCIHGRKLCDPDNVFTSNYISCIYEHNAKRFGPHFSTVHNYKESKYNEQLLS